jgi:ATP-binding cassette, subfamily C, bacterial
MQFLAFLRRKYPLVRQHSEEDCGAACFAAIARYYGATLTLSRIREAIGTGQQGTTLLGLKRGAEVLGFNARSVKAVPEILDYLNEIPLPAIIHWKGNHWVVLYGQQNQKYVVADPALGLRYLSKKELADGWTDWVMLLLESDPARLLVESDLPPSGLGRFLQRAWSYRLVLAEAFLINIVLGLLSLGTPFLIQILTDDVLIRGDLGLLNAVAIAVLVMNLVSSTLSLVQSNLIAHFAQRLELSLVLEFGRQILRLPLLYYETRRSGEIVSRLQDIQAINQLVSQVVVSLPGQFFIAAISLGFMLFYSPSLTGAALLISGIMTFSAIAFFPILEQKVRSVLALDAENQGVLVETFKGALTLKTTAAAPQFWEELQSRFGRLANFRFRTIQIGIINHSFSGLVSGIGSIALLWLGSQLVIQRSLSVGQLLAFNGMNSNFLFFISTIVRFVDEFTQAKAATERLTEVIDSPPEIQENLQMPWEKIAGDGDITCTNLNFYYPGRLELLQDFSLTIPGGKVTALIGKSGCGKSTLAKLIAGLYPLQSGNIRLGLYNLRDIALECLRQQVVLVPQEPHFWSRSILENFRLGYPQATLAEIIRACQIVEADEFIARLPEQYHTVLGEFGAGLSGGQRQRLAIARGLLSNPPILILDESTAGLDPVSEAQLLHNLLRDRAGKTTILISHRPQVIHLADWVVTLDEGRLAIQGWLVDLQGKPGPHWDFLNAAGGVKLPPEEARSW